ncbi:MAG: hypothetical protein WDW36_004874 [Sanguina aurantia]
MQAGNAITPFVSVSITNKHANCAASESPSADVKDLQARTRICYRNRNPMLEQCLLFPLKCVQPDAVVKFSVYNDNVLTSPITSKGLVSTLAMGPKLGGELLFSVAVVDAEGYVMLRQEVVQMLEPLSLHNRLKGMSLTVHLRSLRNVNVQGISSLVDESGANGTNRFNYEVRIGGLSVTKPLRVKAAPPGAEDPTRGVGSVEIDDQVVIDLNECFNDAVASRTKKQINEVGDVRIYFKYGRETLFKTQVPIWDIPLKPSSGLPALSAPSLTINTAASRVGSILGTLPDSPRTDSTALGSNLSCSSLPGTPNVESAPGSPFFAVQQQKQQQRQASPGVPGKGTPRQGSISQDAIATVCQSENNEGESQEASTLKQASDSTTPSAAPSSLDPLPEDGLPGKTYIRLMELYGMSWMAMISQTARGTLPQNLTMMTQLAQRNDTFLQLEVTMKLAETPLPLPSMALDGELSLAEGSAAAAAAPTIPKPLSTPPHGGHPGHQRLASV